MWLADHFRAWLARHKIEPDEITCETVCGVTTVRIQIDNPDDAQLLKQRFEAARERVRKRQAEQLRSLRDRSNF